MPPWVPPCVTCLPRYRPASIILMEGLPPISSQAIANDMARRGYGMASQGRFAYLARTAGEDPQPALVFQEDGSNILPPFLSVQWKMAWNFKVFFCSVSPKCLSSLHFWLLFSDSELRFSGGMVGRKSSTTYPTFFLKISVFLWREVDCGTFSRKMFD